MLAGHELLVDLGAPDGKVLGGRVQHGRCGKRHRLLRHCCEWALAGCVRIAGAWCLPGWACASCCDAQKHGGDRRTWQKDVRLVDPAMQCEVSVRSRRPCPVSRWQGAHPLQAPVPTSSGSRWRFGLSSLILSQAIARPQPHREHERPPARPSQPSLTSCGDTGSVESLQHGGGTCAALAELAIACLRWADGRRCSRFPFLFLPLFACAVCADLWTQGAYRVMESAGIDRSAAPGREDGGPAREAGRHALECVSRAFVSF